MTHSSHISDSLPLSETTYFILLCLSAAPKHGYAIMKEVQQLSDGRLQLSTGTLYGAIKRLLEDGWIVRAPDHNESARPRKAYTLTSDGRRLLAAELARLRSLVAVAQRFRLGESA